MRPPEAPTNQERPRNWHDVRLANGINHRIIYSVHDPAHPREPEELGNAQLVGLEGLYGRVPDVEYTRRMMNGLVDPAGTDENNKIVFHALANHIPLFFVDMYGPGPEEALFEQIMKLDSEKNAASGTANSVATTVAALALLASNHKSLKAKPTRRGFLQGAAGVTMLTALSPRIETLLAQLQIPPGMDAGTVPPEGIHINEESLVRQAQKFFRELSAVELGAVFGQIDYVRTFRDVVMAEKMWQVAEIAKERGLTHTANIVGMAHSGMELAFRLSSETRRAIIDYYLNTLERNGIDPQVVAQMRESVTVLPEATWSRELRNWDVTLHSI